MNSAAFRPRSLLLLAPSRDLTFVENDVTILSQVYDVDVVTRTDFPSRRQLLPEVRRRLRDRRHVAVFVWFAEPYDSLFVTLLARCLRCRTIIVPGGYETTSLPNLGYGGLLRRRDGLKVRLALQLADAVFPTSDLLAEEVLRLCTPRRLRVIYPGIDCNLFAPDGPRERTVVTVGTVGAKTWQLKGLDVFACISKRIPEARFLVVGPCTDAEVHARLRTMGGPNLDFTTRRLPAPEMAEVFKRACVAAQLSARESFGIALAEAMATGCVPVATRVGFLPEVVGDTGLLVEHHDISGTVEAIRTALESGDGLAARRRVCTRFGFERRRHSLLESVRQVTG